MSSYESFAQVYDLFMDNIPYEEWGEYVHELLKERGVEDGLVVDLGCGTGSLTELLAQRGYDMIGVDLSMDMLQIAMEKKAESELDILYLMQDMRELELFGTVRAAVSVCDSMNYITDEEDLLEVFRLVNNYLDPGAPFIFDMNTMYKYETQLADNVIAESREESAFIWENEGTYERFQETHFQKAYPVDLVCGLLEEAGLQVEAVYDAFTHEPPKPDSERVYFVARECTK